jgi:hypothetical protein
MSAAETVSSETIGAAIYKDILDFLSPSTDMNWIQCSPYSSRRWGVSKISSSIS